jgi:prepilin-type N-terminal cleavage/methylation domain-containing protein
MNKPRGFTLIEMLVVLAIIGTLLAIGLPLTRSFVGKSREAACLTQLRSLGVGLQAYLQEHNDKLPELATGRSSKTDDIPVLETILLPYLESPEAFHCPTDKKEFQRSGSSYLWNATQNGRHISQLALFGIKNQPDKIPLIYEKEAWHPSGMNFLYADMSSSNKFRLAAGN